MNKWKYYAHVQVKTIIIVIRDVLPFDPVVEEAVKGEVRCWELGCRYQGFQHFYTGWEVYLHTQVTLWHPSPLPFSTAFPTWLLTPNLPHQHFPIKEMISYLLLLAYQCVLHADPRQAGSSSTWQQNFPVDGRVPGSSCAH